MNTCQYCKTELNSENQINENTCRDCGVPPEAIEEPVINIETSSEETDLLLAASKELQFIRFQQYRDGETDEIMTKRCLSEIVLMMEQSLNKAKSHVTKSSSIEQMRARHSVLNAIVYGLAFIANHPIL